jgi:cystathionine beta-synthase
LPENVNIDLIDHFEKVTDRDAAIMTRRIPREEGIFAGNSAGSAMAGLMQMKHMFKPTDVVVVIFHDHGTRYLGKMFNDDWMRDRGFLEIKKPKALDLIASHKNQKLVTIESSATIAEALQVMNKFGISQIPVKKGTEFVGSLNDNYLFSKLLEDNNNIKSKLVLELMQAPFPFVNEQTPMEEISKLITKENNAVLMTDLAGSTHIITKHDLIQGISQMGN